MIKFSSFTFTIIINSLSVAAMTAPRAGSSPPSTITTLRERSSAWRLAQSFTPFLGHAAGTFQGVPPKMSPKPTTGHFIGTLCISLILV